MFIYIFFYIIIIKKQEYIVLLRVRIIANVLTFEW